MTRRALLALLTGAALDPERLLYRPGRKLISIPHPPAFRHDPLYEVNAMLSKWSKEDLIGFFNPTMNIAALYDEHFPQIVLWPRRHRGKAAK